MRIAIDMQGAQTQSRFRGIGRYTMAFVEAIVRNRGDHEVFLILNGLLPDAIQTIRDHFESLLPSRNILVWYAPGPVMEIEPGNTARREVAESIREAFLESLKPDVVHVTSVFEGFVDDAATSVHKFDAQTPASIALYDLIPLLNREHYLKPDPAYADFYLRKVEYLKQASCLLAISDFARNEGLEYLGMNGKPVINVSTAIDARFREVVLDDRQANDIRKKYGLTGGFILYTGGADQRKNLPRLIQAYAALPVATRDEVQLLFAGKMHEANIDHLSQEAKKAGLSPNHVRFTGYVDDDELVQLYNLCQVYVFPSWHEGFGLPALEAMACGAPVIGANTSSLPEVIGNDEALFDPFSVSDMTAKLNQALTSDVFRASLRKHGAKRAAHFSWDSTAQRAITAWEALQSDSVKHPSGIAESWPDTGARLEGIYRRLVTALSDAIREADGYPDKAFKILANCIDQNERTVLQVFRTRTLPEKVTWRLEGPFDSSYSLALVNREIARALSGLGHRVALHSTEGPGDFPAAPEFLNANPDLAQMHSLASRVPESEADVVSRNLYPPRVEDMEGRLNLLHAYGWEESGFPQQWVETFNQSLQGVTVMSEHVRKIMIDNGVTVPLAVSGLGVDHWNSVRADKNYRLEAKSFRFLHVSSCFPRKGVDRMLEAYGQAFSAKDDVSLIIKTFDNPHNAIDQWLNETRSALPDFPDVVVLKEDFSDSKLKALYEQCHALVAPSRAEGFGLPMAEAMLAGQAVITTGWGGQLDFCTPETAWLVDFDFARAETHFGLFSSVWADPDVSDLARAMTEVCQLSKADRRRRIDAGRELLLSNFRWSNVAERLTGAAQCWSRSSAGQEPRVGWVSTWSMRCGIATYSEHLLNQMPQGVTVFAPRSPDTLVPDGPEVERCWLAGDTDNLEELSARVTEKGVDTLLIQFNYGFFDFSAFSDFLNKQIDEGRVVVVMLHATTDPSHASHKKLADLVPAFARCQRLLVHSPNDMNRLKAHGLIENVALFPHGVLDFIPSSEQHPGQNRTFVVGSYGFFLPQKGLLELIEAIGILREQGQKVELRMFNAEYPVADSRLLIEKAREKIDEMSVGDFVTMCTDYLEDSTCLSELAKLDLIVFPYRETGESASGAVRYGLTSAKPVAVTPLPIFDDVSDAVFRLPGQSPHEIATGIAEIREKLERNDPSVEHVQRTAALWREQHRYSVVANRLFNMLVALGKSGLPSL
ncbi:MAG: glycosyltransferase [Pseudomonadota bacterium]|nr:glycosyltransferase [Pseudomonadota bacterium]